jgi:MscS family membrane protein
MVIDNQQLMPARRIYITLGVTYDSTPAQIRAAIEGIEKIIRSTDGMSPDGILVRFYDFGASSLDIKVRCFTVATGFDEYTRVRQELLLQIMELIEQLDMSIAFPSQTLYFGRDEALTLRAPGSIAPPEGDGGWEADPGNSEQR